MWDVRIVECAGAQFNRISRQQLLALGLTQSAIDHLVRTNRLHAAHEGVFGIAPILEHDPWGRWMAATLTAPGSVLSHLSAATAWGLWSLPVRTEVVTRPGSGGRRRESGVIVFRSSTLAGDVRELEGIPITAVPRTILDLAMKLSATSLARLVRDAVRLKLTTVSDLTRYARERRGARGVARLRAALVRYSGLPLDRARSGAEIRALELLRDANRPLPLLNVRIAGEEADLSWARHRLIIEIDGKPFHLDVGEDARKQAAWEAAGWRVTRLEADDVYEQPHRLLELAPE
jgi:Protein of unknown function (DUF559)